MFDDLFIALRRPIEADEALESVMNLDKFISEMFPGEYTTHPDISILEKFVRQFLEDGDG